MKCALPLLSFSLSARYVYPLNRMLSRLWMALYTHGDFLSVLEQSMEATYIMTLNNNPIDYYNRKKFHSIVLQVLVAHEYKFINTYIG